MNEYYDFVIELTKKAGEMVKERYHQDISINFKGGDPRDIVTDVDLRVSEFITDEIKKKYPDHVVYSEEAQNTDTGEYVWTIDPIDGTHNFSRGFYHFSVCIGLLHNGEPFVGAVFNPITNELFSFEKGGGAYLNGEKINVSKRTELEGSFFLLRSGRKDGNSEWGSKMYKRFLDNKMKTSNLGSSALDICFVAAGRVEATVYGTLSTKDITCAIGILEEAGGELIQLEDDTEKISNKSQKTLAVANSNIKEKILPLILQ